MRYQVVPPTKDGYRYWTVIDTLSEFGLNFALLTIHADAPNAEQIAQDACDAWTRLEQR